MTSGHFSNASIVYFTLPRIVCKISGIRGASICVDLGILVRCHDSRTRIFLVKLADDLLLQLANHICRNRATNR